MGRSGTLIPISVVEFETLISNYEANIAYRRKIDEDKFWKNIKQDMMRPRWFGLVKPAEPTQEEMEAYAKKSFEYEYLGSFLFEDLEVGRKKFAGRMRLTAAAARTQGIVFLAREDAERLQLT